MTVIIKSKLLHEGAWKDVLAKNKAIKDNGMLKSLADIRKLGEEEHDEAQKKLDELVKLMAQMKKSKEVAANPAVSKFLAEISSAADVALKDVAKSKAESEKKAKLVVVKDAKAKGRDESEGEEEEEEGSDLLTTKMIPLLRQVNKGQVMHVLVARAGKQVAVMMARKPISPSKRKLLADQLGNVGGIKYFGGHCVGEDGTTTFVLKSEVSGLAKQLKLALLNQTGLRVKRLACRGQDGETDEHEDEEDRRGGDDADGEDSGDGPRFVPSAEAEDANRGAQRERDGDASAQTARLAAVPQAWDGTRELLQRRISALKRAVESHIEEEDDDQVEQINGHLQKLDRILGKLDRRLAESLESAATVEDPSERREALREARGIVADYIRYVASEPLIDHVDSNPFGVKTDLKATLTATLTKLVRAIG